MTKLERDFASISRYMPVFYGALTAAMAALPLFDRALELLPPVLEQRTVASLAGTITAIALIGRSYLKSQEAGRDSPLPIGTKLLIIAVLLTVAYVGVAEYIEQYQLTVSFTLEVAFIVWYVSLYGLFSLGMWQMAWRAYKMRDAETELMLP